MSNHHCKYCGASLMHKRSNASFCSGTCRSSYWLHHKANDSDDDIETVSPNYPIAAYQYSEPEPENDLDDSDYEDDFEGDDFEDAEIVETETALATVPDTRYSDDLIPDREARVIRANGIFLRYLIQLRNVFEKTIKKKAFLNISTLFTDLRERYVEIAPNQYALYPFGDQLETVIAELESYKQSHIEEEQKEITFYINEEFEVWVYDLCAEISQHNDLMKKRFDSQQ